MVGSFTLVARIFGIPFFCQKMVAWKKHFTFFLEKSCLSAFPKRIRSLMKASLKNGVSTNVRDTGPWEGPIHLTLVGLFPRVHNCSKLFQSWSWSQKKKEKPFTKATCFFSFSVSFSFSFSFYVSFSFPFSFSSSSPSSSSSSSSFSFSFSRSLYFSLVLSLFLSLITPLPVVPHKAVAEVSKIGNL